MMTPVLTAYVGSNDVLCRQAIPLYVPRGSKVLDMTYGLGVFWKRIDTSNYEFVRNDLDEARGDIHYDFRCIPMPDGSFDAIVLDPPYAGRSGSPIKASIDRNYNIRHKALEQGIVGTESTMQFYLDGMKEAVRLLKPSGVLFVKCMDEIMGGKQRRNHITLWRYALDLGLTDEDLFVLVQNGVPTMRHDYQLHARKNNSFLWVFRKAHK